MVSPGFLFYSEKVPLTKLVNYPAVGLLPAIIRFDLDPVWTKDIPIWFPKMGFFRSKLGSPDLSFRLSAAKYFSLVALSICLN